VSPKHQLLKALEDFRETDFKEEVLTLFLKLLEQLSPNNLQVWEDGIPIYLTLKVFTLASQNKGED